MLILDYTYIKSKEEEKYICILLHGYGDNQTSFGSKLVPLLNLPNTSYIIPNAPQPMGFDGAYQWFPLTYDENTGGIGIQSLKVIEDSDKILHEFIHQVVKKYNVPLEKIMLFGFSQGGIMALFNALHTLNNFAAVVCHSGAYFENKSSVLNEKQNIMLVHGKKDIIVPFDFTQKTLDFFNKNGIKCESLFIDDLDHGIVPQSTSAVNNFFAKHMRIN